MLVSSVATTRLKAALGEKPADRPIPARAKRKVFQSPTRLRFADGATPPGPSVEATGRFDDESVRFSYRVCRGGRYEEESDRNTGNNRNGRRSLDHDALES